MNTNESQNNRVANEEQPTEQSSYLSDLEPKGDVKGGAERDPLPAILVDPVDPAADKGNRIRI